jgi:hypothetical protein
MLLVHKAQAIRNRGYTNEVRLRGLNQRITHEGGFCLCSCELHSPFIFNAINK